MAVETLPFMASRWKNPSYSSVSLGVSAEGSMELNSIATRAALTMVSLEEPGCTLTPVNSTTARPALKFSYWISPSVSPSRVYA